jgi:hypothetical protein
MICWDIKDLLRFTQQWYIIQNTLIHYQEKASMDLETPDISKCLKTKWQAQTEVREVSWNMAFRVASKVKF